MIHLERITDPTSDNFKRAVDLGDENARTLGFLPQSAFANYATQGQLIGAFSKDTKEIQGYILYRISYHRVTIVHCCVSKNHRNKNIAYSLVEYLKKNTKQYAGIRLSCRNDYGINHVWERFHFVPVKEKRGRSKEGLPLTIWWYPHYQNDLLSQISDYELNNKMVAVIDMNVFLDIKEEREEESLALKSDWLLSEAILYYTREIHVEINRAKTSKMRESGRKLLASFDELPFRDEEEYSTILKELKLKFPSKSENDNSDLRHLAYSIVGKAQFFITRDTELIQNKSFFKKYDLKVHRPSDFITHLDENIQISKYKPQRLLGAQISSRRITSDTIEPFINQFLKPSERKNHFERIIRTALSSPEQFELLTISKLKEVLAFVVFDRTDKEKLRIPIFRFLNTSLRITLSKHLLFKAVHIATRENRIKIDLTEEHLEEEIVRTIIEARFLKFENCWQKMNLKGIFEEEIVLDKIINQFHTDDILRKLPFNEIRNGQDFHRKYNIERYFSPLKIKDLAIPTFIVPIKPLWAQQLFDDRSEEKLDLFEPEYELLLNRENVYYRSSSPNVLQAPSRILWYVSENKATGERGHIRASSYVDEIFIDEPKKLYKQFEQLGIYKWKHVSETSGAKNEVMAFVFSDTELFKKPIALNTVTTIFNELEEKKFMIVTPVKVKRETYLALYKLGMEEL